MSFKDDVKALREKFSLKVTDVVSENEIVAAAKEIEKEVKCDKEKFEDVTLLDGTMIMVEPAVEVGAAAVVMSDDIAQPLPVGEYELSDNRVIVVEEAGLIAAVNDPNIEVEEEVTEELAEDDKVKEAKRVIESIVTEKIFVSQKDFTEMKEAFTKQIEDLTQFYADDKTDRVEFKTEVIDLIEKIGDEPKEEPTQSKFKGFKNNKNYFINTKNK